MTLVDAVWRGPYPVEVPNPDGFGLVRLEPGDTFKIPAGEARELACWEPVRAPANAKTARKGDR